MLAISHSSIVKRRRLEASRIEDDMVLFDDRVGKYYAMGPVGADIWQLIGEPVPVSTIVQSLVADYDIDQVTCEREVLQFLEAMLSEGLVETVE